MRTFRCTHGHFVTVAIPDNSLVNKLEATWVFAGQVYMVSGVWELPGGSDQYFMEVT